jgi:hypothetical protein
MIKGAIISSCGRYRYMLWRAWRPEEPRLPFVMLNPSTADAEIDDPTIRRCMAFARREGFGGIRVINLFAYRATDPGELITVGLTTAVGPDNARHFDDVCAECWVLTRQSRDVPIVCAWGAHPLAAGYAEAARAEIAKRGVQAVCLGTTKAGEPRHPLYVKGSQPLVPL